MPKLDSALPAVIWSWRTVRGSSASRDGRCSDDVAASRAATTKISAMLGSARNALARQHRHQHSWASPGADQQPAPVDVVGQRAAVQAEDDERHQLDEPDRADQRSWSRSAS